MTEQQKQIAPKAPDVGSMLNDPKFKAQLAAALPRHMTPDRMARIAMTELRKNPELLRCDPISFIGAVIQCAQLGLEPGNGLGHAYLIPFWDRKNNVRLVNMIPGYKGLIDLARRSGQIQTISARVVRENDQFDYEYGLNERLEHVPARGDGGEIIAVYAVARLKDGGTQFEVMSVEQVHEIRKRNGKNNPVWESDFAEMARKTAVRRIVKYLPMSPEMATTIDLDNKAFNGEAQSNYALVDVNYEPKQILSEDATTVAAVNAEEAQTAALSNVAELKRHFMQRMLDLSKDGTKTSEIYRHLGYDKAPNIADYDAPRMIALIEALKTYKAGA